MKTLFKTLVPIALSGVALWLSGCGATSTSAGIGSPIGSPATPQQATQSTGNCDPTAGFSAGDGSAASPYQVTTECQVQNMISEIQYESKSFIIENDIDLTGITLPGVIDFAGTLDGNHKTLSNYATMYPLFNSNSGTIKDLTLSQVQMNFNDMSRQGALVGTNLASGQISNCSVSGTLVTGPLTNEGYFIGGLVGFNQGTVSHSSANVQVTGNSAVGALVGENQGTITASHAIGTVSAAESGTVIQFAPYTVGAGGLAGDNATTGSITDSYAQVAVTGASDLGGLVGTNAGNVIDCYSTGAVGGTGSNFGGLIGVSTSGLIQNSYWDTMASGLATSAAGTGETTANLQSQSTYSGWNFTSTWTAPNGGYPSLR